MAHMENWPRLGRLRMVLNKIKLLLGFNVHRWLFPAYSSQRMLSFSDRPGLRVCMDEDDDDPFSESGGSSKSFRGRLGRTASYPSEDDVDRRAEQFIENFHKRLELERQVSLELRYCRTNSFESRSP